MHRFMLGPNLDWGLGCMRAVCCLAARWGIGCQVQQGALTCVSCVPVPPMLTTLSINEVPAAHRAAAWRDAVCDTFVRLECTPERRAPLHGCIQAGMLGQLHVARVQSSPQFVERTRTRAQQADEAFVLLSVQLRGRTVVQQGQSQAVLTPGCIAFYDTTRPYTLSLPNDFDQIVLHLPHHMLQGKTLSGLDHMAERLHASNPFAQAILALAPQLLRMVGAARPAIAERTCAAAVELIALAMDSLADQPSTHSDEPTPTQGVAADALVWRTRELISRQLDDTELSPARLASQVHVSLRRLQEVFQLQGTTLSDSIWDMRLDFARSLLASAQGARESISTIAYRAGFGDLAHFSRRFRQRYGVSPSEFRASLHC
jgi:AraC-like DNA-binding protein